MFFVFAFFVFFKLIESYETKICGLDKNVTLVESENGAPNLIFIQSPGYPRSMSDEEIKKCQFNFFKDTNDTALKFVITNGNVKNIELTGVIEHSVTGTYYYEAASTETFLIMKYVNNSSSLNSWHAFQGYVLSESMEICHPNYEPIKFENESQIIYLRPHNINDTKFSCNWAFIGPKEYGFKFVIREAHKDLNLTVTTSSGYDVIKGYGIRKNQAYYNPDNFLNISVDGNKDDFEAYVTFVKNHYNVGDANCSLTKDIKTRGLIWTNIRDIAYPTNSECKNEVPLSNDEFVILKIVKFQAEPFADYIEITDNWDKKHYINHHNPTSWPLSFLPAFFSNPNKINNSLILRFISDGSVQNEGFELNFKTLNCKCASQFIAVPCEGKHKYKILEQSSEYICPNTICYFTVITNPKCPLRYLVLTFDRNVITEDPRIGFKVFTNNETYLDSTTFTRLYHETISIPFKSNSILSFFSLKSESFATEMSLEFFFMAVEKPKVWQSSKLSEENPSVQFDLMTMPKHSIFSVELDENMVKNNETIEMFTAQFVYLSCFLLYENKNLRKMENSLMKMQESTNKISSPFSITIYKSLNCEDINISIFCRAKKAHSKHCVFSENIFNRLPSNPIITQISKSSGTCEIILLSHKVFQIQKLWTKKHGDLVKESKPLQKYYPSSSLYTKIKIPPNSSIYINTSFESKETVNFYKLPIRNLFDIPTKECDKNGKHSDDKTTIIQTCNFDNYEIGFKDSVYIFDLLNKTKILKENLHEYTILQNSGFDLYFNDTHDKWGKQLPQDSEYNGHRKLTNIIDFL